MLYNNLSKYLKTKYGGKVSKICIDGGFGCPNRDGTCGVGGCIYCGERGAGEHIDPSVSIRMQVERALERDKRSDSFIAYFQNFTNTYAPTKVLKERYDSALISDRIVALAIGTRPDCISEEIAEKLGIDESTVFDTYYEDGRLIIAVVDEDEEYYDEDDEDYYDDEEDEVFYICESCDDRNYGVKLKMPEMVLAYLLGEDVDGKPNVVYNGKGYNTDWLGFCDSVASLVTRDDKALLLGTGGVSKAIQYGLKQMGIGYTLVSRQAMSGMIRYEDLDDEIIDGHRLIVNCTPLGMCPYEDELPALPYELLGRKHVLYDCIYNPGKTLFLQQGEARGCRIKNGLEMLHIQADYAWKIWNEI